MAEGRRFQYRPMCSYPHCEKSATCKVGATWTDGTSRELKNYGLACEDHGQFLLDRATKNRDGLRLADGETVGPVKLFRLEPGRRDAELSSIEQG